MLRHDNGVAFGMADEAVEQAAYERQLAGDEEIDDHGAEPAAGKAGKPTQAQQLVAFAVEAEGKTADGEAAEAELFHTAKQEPYARVVVDDHLETWPLRSKTFRRYLGLLFYRAAGKPPGSQAVQEAIELLAAIALFDRPERRVFTRVAEVDGAIWLDLANPEWEAVKVTAAGWRVLTNPPVAFRRPAGMAPLPQPQPGGKLAELRDFLNVAEGDWPLLVAFLVAMVRPRGPYPVLNLLGGQGSAKTTTARVLRDLVDPNAVGLRGEPRNLRDLAIAGTNNHVAGFDNLSSLPAWLSDGLCRLATGGGFATRELYTDDAEALFDFQKPVLVTGIEELAVRGDLLDRSLLVYLPPVGEEDRRAEEELWAAYDRARPRLLGALLDASAVALRRLPEVRLDRLPRMADFTRWAVAAAPGLGIDPDDFLAAYRDNRQGANELALEASPVAREVRALVEDDGAWSGTATELLAALNRRVAAEARPARGWPGTPRALSNALRRVQPNLRQVGVVVRFRREADARRIELETVGRPASSASPPSGQHGRDDAGDASDADDAAALSVSRGDGWLPRVDYLDERRWCATYRRWFDPDDPAGACPTCRDQLQREQHEEGER
jgi:hypothetical protein